MSEASTTEDALWSASESHDVRDAFKAVPILGSTKKEDEGDWDNWEWRIKLAFERARVFGVVTSDRDYKFGYEEEPTDRNSDAYKSFHLKSAWAYSKIVQYASASSAKEVRHTSDARQAFQILKASHSIPGDQELGTRLVQLTELKAQTNKDVLSTFLPTHLELLSAFRRICPDFISLSDGIVYNTLVATGLPSTWDSWRQTLRANNGYRDKVDTFLTSIRHEALLRERGNEDAHASAHLVVGKKQSSTNDNLAHRISSPPQKKKMAQCYNCNGKNHLSFECRFPWTEATKAACERRFGPGTSTQMEQKSRAHANLAARLSEPSEEQWGPITPTNDIVRASGYVAASLSTQKSDAWIFDSGASHSITHNRALFTTYRPSNTTITLGDGSSIPAAGEGTISLKFITRNGTVQESIENVLHSPAMHINLLSSTHLTKTSSPYTSEEKNGVKTLLRDGHIIAEATVKTMGIPEVAVANVATVIHHHRLELVAEVHNATGHPGRNAMLDMLRRGSISSVTSAEIEAFYLYPCAHCAEAKTTRASFTTNAPERDPSSPLAVVHSDIAGPYSVPSLGNARYFVTLIDSCGWHDVRTIQRKSDAVTSVRDMLIQTRQRHQGKSPLTMRTDNGSEYTSHDFKRLLQSHKIWHQTSIAHTPEQNGVAERANRTLNEKTTALLSQAGLPKPYWAEAIQHAAYLVNRTPSARNDGLSPFEVTHKRPPMLDKLPVWGEHVWVHVPNQGKAFVRAVRCRFMGIGDAFGKRAMRVQSIDDGRFFFTGEVRRVDTRFERETEQRLMRPPVEDSPLPAPNVIEALTSTDETTSSSDEEEGNAAAPPRASYTPSTPRTTLEPDQEERTTLRPDLAERNVTSLQPDQEERTTLRPDLEERNLLHPDRERTTSRPDQEEESRVIVNAKSAPTHTKHTWTYEMAPPESESEEHLAQKYSNGVTATSGHYSLRKRANLAYANVVRTTGPIDLKGREPPTIPNSLQEELASPYANEWTAARADEDMSMQKHGVFHYVARPPNTKIIGSRYHHSLKTNSAGEVTRFKTRLIAQGFGQRPGVDYEEAIAPVASLTTIKLGLAYIAHERLEAYTIDVKTAYLYATLDKSKGIRYMEQPPGSHVLDANGQLAVCELDKAIYGLPEAAAAWYEHLRSFLDTMHFESVVEDTCVFVGTVGRERVIFIVYVDDAIIACSSLTRQKFMDRFGSKFDVEEKGTLNGSTFVGFEITYDREEGLMTIRQEGSVNKLLRTAELERCRPIDTPVQEGLSHGSQDKDSPAIRQHEYLVLVGILQWIVHTRPDLAYAVSLAARWSSNPGKDQWTWLTRIIRYVAGTRKAGLLFGSNEQAPNSIVLYTDADFAGCVDTRRSTSGVVIHAFGSPILHWSRKQRCITNPEEQDVSTTSGQPAPQASSKDDVPIATSTKEAELVAMYEGIKDAEWVARLMTSFVTHATPITALCDNQTAVGLVQSTKRTHEKRRFIDIPLKYARAVYHDTKTVNVDWISGTDNMADLLTKALPRETARRHATAMGMIGL